MGILELLLLAVGLSMDAFAVAICKGLAMNKIKFIRAIWVGLWFGAFQGLMPLVGYFGGKSFYDVISKFDHWVAFALLVLIGSNMIREVFFGNEETEEFRDDTSVKTMLLMAIATSIDALAVGITFSCVKVSIISAGATINTIIGCAIIAATTFIISTVGVCLGNKVGGKYRKPSEITGGVILVLLGLKILLEGLGVIG